MRLDVHLQTHALSCSTSSQYPFSISLSILPFPPSLLPFIFPSWLSCTLVSSYHECRPMKQESPEKKSLLCYFSTLCPDFNTNKHELHCSHSLRYMLVLILLKKVCEIGQKLLVIGKLLRSDWFMYYPRMFSCGWPIGKCNYLARICTMWIVQKRTIIQ